MTPMLQKLNIGIENKSIPFNYLFFSILKGDTIEMSSCEGTFDITRIDMCQTLILIAAGTGLTPMIRTLNSAIKQNNDKQLNVLVLFFNKTQNDILCREELQTISDQYK